MKNLDIIEVKGYYEKVVFSCKTKPSKAAVLKVRYEDGSWDTIYRYLLKHKFSNMNYIDQYKNIELNQIKQISYLVSKKEESILKLYLKRYIKDNLNMKTSITTNNLRLYVENMKERVLTKTKYVLQQI